MTTFCEKNFTPFLHIYGELRDIQGDFDHVVYVEHREIQSYGKDTEERRLR